MGALSLKASLLIMGLSGIVAQIILLRELLVTFLGNELILGIILANWLIMEAAGSFVIGRSVEKAKRKLELYVLFQIVFSITLPFSIYLARVFKNIFLAAPGEAVGFTPIFYSSLLILMPVALPHGALFTYGCRNYSLYFRSDASSIGKVYVLETIGSIAGGLLITFLLVQRLHSFEIAFLISLTNTLISIFLLRKGHTGLSVLLRKGLLGVSIFLTLLFTCVLFSPLSNRVHSSSIRTQWRGLNVLHNENSIYGNITVTKRDGQFTFFTDGIPSITAPVPDIASIEDFVHFTFLLHEKPESVLIISGGAGGMIHEILKYPVRRVDYVELDPLLMKLIKKFSTPLTRSELSDRRVTIHYTDGRFFTKRTREKYDIIFIGLSAPQELQANRLFSFEFFSIAKEKMNQDGIIVLTLPGSLAYISPELRDLNGCILDTMKSVYKHVRIIPGDVNLYFASDSEKLKRVTSEEMIERLEKRKIKTSLFTDDYIVYRLNERRLKWYFQFMERKEVYINSDFHPLGVFFSLSYWNTLYSPFLAGIFKWIEGLSLNPVISALAVLTLFAAIIFIKRPKTFKLSLPYAVFTSGFGGMIFDLVIIFTFQTLYGYLYYQLGLLVTVFMVGVACSSYYITRRLDRVRKDTFLFLITELCFICFAVFLPFAFLIPSRYIEKQEVYVLLYAVFLTMSFLSGVLIGFQFPVAARIHLKTSSRKGGLGHTSGLLYGADLLGGYFGGLIGGVLLLPVLGIKESCFILAMIKVSSFLFFLLSIKMRD
jgi:spermidine synthase